MFRHAHRASSRAMRLATATATPSSRNYASAAVGSSGSAARTSALALSALGGIAYYIDTTHGPVPTPHASWSEWLESRRAFYGGALARATANALTREYRQDVFFSYEKRLRAFSPPEKVFEYFASVRGDNGTYMTLSDLVRSLLPLHPPVGSNDTRAGRLHGERAHGDETHEKLQSALFKLFDTDGNGLIDFSEFLFFQTLLTIDRNSANVTFQKFDTDANGLLDAKEFAEMMKFMRISHGTHATGLRTGLKTGNIDMNSIGGGLLDYLFTPKRNKMLTEAKFNDFLSSLRREMDNLEFSHYDTKKSNSITLRDFGYSLVCQAKLDVLPTLLASVKKLPGYESKKRIKREDFLAFARIAKHSGTEFQKQMHELDEAGVDITRTKFKSLAKRVAGENLSDDIIDVVFSIFDVDGDGSLSYDEFYNALITWK